MSRRLKTLWELIQEVLSEWSNDNASRLAAALAYFTVFSIAPLLLVIVAVVGLVVGRQQVESQVLAQVGNLVGSQGQQFVAGVLHNMQNTSTNVILAVAGAVTIVFGATGLLVQLQGALNRVWNVKPEPGQGPLSFIRSRALSLAILLIVGFLLLLSLFVSTALRAVSSAVPQGIAAYLPIVDAGNAVLSFVIITVLFAVLFKYLPDVEIGWRDVWAGAVITALLFGAGKYLISLYLGHSGIASTYGAAASLVLILVWVYYSAQIVLLGAEITQVYARHFGSRIMPADNAVRLTQARRSADAGPAGVAAANGQPDDLQRPPSPPSNASSPTRRKPLENPLEGYGRPALALIGISLLVVIGTLARD